MTEAERRQNIEGELQRGAAALRSAELLLEHGELADAVSRAYYAAFHHARALLLSEGVEPKRHATVDRLVQWDFVRTGKLDPDVAGRLSTLQQHRQNADYTAEYVFSATMARELVDAAGSYAAAARQLLTSEGWLDEG